MENLFTITLHCLHVSQATAPYMIFMKLLIIKYSLLVISLKIIRAIVWSFQGEQKAGGSGWPRMRRKANSSSGIEGCSKKAGICGTIEVVCLELHRIRSKMDASALRKGFCQDLNWFYIIAIIFCLPGTFASACFLIAFVSQPPPGKGVYGIAKYESLDSSMRENKSTIM